MKKEGKEIVILYLSEVNGQLSSSSLHQEQAKSHSTGSELSQYHNLKSKFIYVEKEKI
jgi:hypothetical protein